MVQNPPFGTAKVSGRIIDDRVAELLRLEHRREVEFRESHPFEGVHLHRNAKARRSSASR